MSTIVLLAIDTILSNQCASAKQQDQHCYYFSDQCVWLVNVIISIIVVVDNIIIIHYLSISVIICILSVLLLVEANHCVNLTPDVCNY